MIRFWLVAAVALILDQYTKHVVATNFVPGESRIAIPHVLWWTYVQNFHGAFGMFGSQTWVLVLMAVAVLALFGFLFKDAASQSPLLRAAFGGIVGGAIGNIVDRFHYGYVVDFADLHWWPVFNVADSFITVCVGVLLVSSLLSSLHRPDATPSPASVEPGHAPSPAPAASPQAPAESPH